MAEYLYLIDCKGSKKIGVANDVVSRLAALQTGNPFPLELIVCFKFVSAEVVEKALHQKFQAARIHGEWFQLDSQEVAAFITLCAGLGGEKIALPTSPSPEDVDDAEEIGIGQNLPTLDDVIKVLGDPAYRIEQRFSEDNGSLRGFAWRLRGSSRGSVLYVGKQNQIFEEVKRLVTERGKA